MPDIFYVHIPKTKNNPDHFNHVIITGPWPEKKCWENNSETVIAVEANNLEEVESQYPCPECQRAIGAARPENRG